MVMMIIYDKYKINCEIKILLNINEEIGIKTLLLF